MKLHIVANRAPWVSWEEKINAIKLFFSPAFHFDVEIEHTDYEIPLIPSPDFPSLYEVDRIWYDQNIADRNADIILLVLDRNQLEVVTPFGLTQWNAIKGKECTVYANEKDRLYVGGKDIGNSFVRWAQHELSHALYAIYGLPDKTHNHFYAGEPDKVVPDFTITDPRFPILLKLRLAYWTAISYFKSLPKERVVDDGQAPPETMQAMVLRVCKEKGLTRQQTNDVYNTVRCESGFNNEAINRNKDVNGNVRSTDYYLCQINDYWHIGPGKSFPSVQYVHDNPEAVVKWMCDLTLAGKLKLWVCYSGGYYKNGYKEVV